MCYQERCQHIKRKEVDLLWWWYKEGKFVRRERYLGECSRSFYIGDDIKDEDIKASFKNGTLQLEIPKKEEKKELPEKRYIPIGD